MVRPTRLELATFGIGIQRSDPTELRALDCLFNISHSRRKSKGFDAVSAVNACIALCPKEKRLPDPLSERRLRICSAAARYTVFLSILYRIYRILSKLFYKKFFAFCFYATPFKTRAYTTDRRNRIPVYIRSRARALPHAQPLFYTRSFSALRSARRRRSA